MNIWMIAKKINQISLPEKEDFYSHLNMEDITNADQVHAKRVCKDFETKHLTEYQNFYLQSSKLFVNRCIWELLKYVSSNV